MSPAAAIEQGITVFADQPFAAAGQSGQFVDVVVGILSAVMAGGDIHPPVAIEIPGGMIRGPAPSCAVSRSLM